MMSKNSVHHRVSEEDTEYEEVDDLIYEGTGTLSFPYPPRIVAGGEGATRADSDRPEAIGAPSARSSLARLVSRLRAASATTPGVSLLATVDVVGGEPASAAKRRERSTASPVAGAKANGASSLAASRHAEPSRGREARSLAPLPNAKRTTQPSLRAKHRKHRSYPSFGQRLLAEVRRIPLAKRREALDAMAAVVVAGVLVAMATLVPRRAGSEEAAPRSSVAAVVAERAPVMAPTPINSRMAAVTTEEGAPEPPSSVITDGTVPPAHREALSPTREPTRNGAQGSAIHGGNAWAADASDYEETTPVRLHRPALEAPLTAGHAKRAKAPARYRARAPMPPSSHAPCDCLPGDPLCGCID